MSVQHEVGYTYLSTLYHFCNSEILRVYAHQTRICRTGHVTGPGPQQRAMMLAIFFGLPC